jgi:hypothetical protein
MNPPRASADDYIDFLIATQHSYSCLEAGRVQPDGANRPAHDAFTRLLYRLEPDTETLWQEAVTQVTLAQGLLLIDDTTLDKPYATKMALVTRHWSGKHRAVVDGINLQTLLWSDGERRIPCDYRLYAKAQDGLTKNDHFRAMLRTAHERGFVPAYVLFDIWYSSLDNLKLVRELKWHFFTQLKANRLVNPDDTHNRPLAECALSEQGTVVHLKGYGMVKVFRIVVSAGGTETHTQPVIEYWATSDLRMTAAARLCLSQQAFAIEHYHRGIKQFCGVEKGQMRLACAQRNHIGLALRAFLRLETYSCAQGLTWFQAKLDIVRSAVTAYLQCPLYSLPTA